MKVDELVPLLMPLTCHCQAGVKPPFTDVAVKVVAVPWHTGLAEAVILTETGIGEVFVTVMGADVAGLPLTQVSLDASTQLTWSPGAGM